MKENNKNNGRGIFYGVIGVATLVVAIIGATFAYFTAQQQAGNNVINGNMATINFGLQVEKVVDPGEASGMIPMSNTMVEKAVSNNGNICKDDNGNAVCQIYKVTVSNDSTATMFVDGYVALTGGSGTSTDLPTVGETTYQYAKNTTGTTMRWAQVFADSDAYSTAGIVKLGGPSSAAAATKTYKSLDAKSDAESDIGKDGFNKTNILTQNISDTATISGNTYASVAKNYIRISDHKTAAGGDSGAGTPDTSFNRQDDATSTLVLSQQLQPLKEAERNDTQKQIATGSTVQYYFVVWLTETGKNQTAGAGEGVAATSSNFFNGLVGFISAQGSEVTATFSGYTAVKSDQTTA